MALQKEKYKNLILHLSHKCANKDNFAKTVLCKLMYFCDFDYYEINEISITGETYLRLPLGPVPSRLDKVLKELEKEKKIKLIKTHFHNYKQQKPISLTEADLNVFSGSEMEVINNVLFRFADFKAINISDYSHEDIPWSATKSNEVIDYELVFYRTPEFSRVAY